MSKETWFRGTSGRSAARAGGYSHPVGDGLYFTDTEAVAWDYALTKWDRSTANSDSRALNPSKQKVFEVRLKRSSLGRVLDLTTDPRWQKYIHTKIGPQTVESLIRINGEMHERFFTGFLKEHKLTRASFDAIIGKDYDGGGRLLCIVSEKGTPTRLAARVSGLMKPIAFRVRKQQAIAKLLAFRSPSNGRDRIIPMRPSTVASKTMRTVSANPGTPRGGSGAGAGVGLAVGVGIIVDFLVVLLMPKLIEKFGKSAEKWLQEDLDKLKPAIDAEIQKQSLFAAHLIQQGKTPYANLTMTLETRHVHKDTYGPYLHPKEVSVNVTATDKNESRDISAPIGAAQVLTGNRLTHELATVSARVDLPAEAVSFYEAALSELEWYQDTIQTQKGHAAAYGMKFMSDDDLAALNEDRDALIGDLADVFHIDQSIARKHLQLLLM